MEWIQFVVAAVFALLGIGCLVLVALSLPGTWIMIGLRDYETVKETTGTGTKVKLENCDLLEVYKDSDKDRLKNTARSVDWTKFIARDLERAQFGKEDLIGDTLKFVTEEEMEIDEIGSKPGEKLYEELMSDEETRRTIELDQFFSVLPAFRGIYNDINYNYSTIVSELVEDPYVSERQISLTIKEVKDFLRDNKLLFNININEQNTRYWPGDKEEKS